MSRRLKSGGYIYGAYSGEVLPPMLALATPGGKCVLVLTEENGFAITDGCLVYGGEPRYYDTSEDLIEQIKENLYDELRDYCGENNGIYSADDFEAFIYERERRGYYLNEPFEDFLEACEQRILDSYYD